MATRDLWRAMAGRNGLTLETQDVVAERRQELGKIVTDALIDELEIRVELLGCVADIHLGLVHAEAIERYAHVAQVILRAHAAERRHRRADDRGRLADIWRIGNPRTPVDRVLEGRRYRVIELWRREQHAVGGADSLAIGMDRRRIAFDANVVVVERQGAELDDLDRHAGGCELNRRLERGAVERALAQAAGDSGNLQLWTVAHRFPPIWTDSLGRRRGAGQAISPGAASGQACAIVGRSQLNPAMPTIAAAPNAHSGLSRVQ